MRIQDKNANSVDLDEVAHYEPPHQDLCCLQIGSFLSPVPKELIISVTVLISNSFISRLGVSDETLKPFLEGWTLDQVIDAKRLFIVDHDILTGLPCRDGFCVSTWT